MNRPLKTMLISVFSIGILSSKGQEPPSGKPQEPTSVSILELFTSEGCSSCPPADDLLRRVNLKQSPAGQLIVGLSEHVTYWNRLGWQDPYSQQLFTDRQSRYAERFSLEGPYTPQMVLDGQDQFVGSDQGALQRALQQAQSRKHLRIVLTSAVRRGDGVDLRLAMSSVGSQHLQVYAALTDDLDRSNVLRGENAGRSLQHVAVVRTLLPIAWGNKLEDVVHVPFPGNFDQGGALKHHAVVFAQEPHQGAIVGAAVAAF